mgnify:FL=1
MADFGLPSADTPWIDKNSGLVNEPWYIYLANLFDALNQGVVGNANEVLHGGGAGYSQVALAGDVSGVLALTNFARSTAADIVIAQGTAAAPAYKALSGDLSMVSTGAVSVVRVSGVTVSGATGTGFVVFGTAPTVTNAVLVAAKASTTFGVGNTNPAASGAGVSFPAA